MKDTERLIGLVEFFTKNVNHNLNYIPDDKLNWKPVPEAKSAMEIASEIAASVGATAAMVKTGEYPKHLSDYATREEVQAAITKAAEDYADTLRNVTEEQLNSTAHFPWGEQKIEDALQLAVIEAGHHHGQIVYIQTLLGDKDSHFFYLNS